MVAVKSLWVLLKSFSTNFSFKRDTGVKVPDHKPDKRIRYNRLRPQWHRPYYPSADPEIGSGGMASGSFVTSSKSYQDYLNGNCGTDANSSNGAAHINSKDFENFINSDSDYEDGDSDADFDDDFTTTDEDEDSDLEDEDEDVSEELLTCEVCERVFPSTKKLADHQTKKRHFGCLQCDSIFPTEKALEFHREQMDHFDFVSDYGTDDASSASAASGSVAGESCRSEVDKCPTNNGNNSAITCCSGRRNIINNNYSFGNQLHASWYEGDDEEEKGLLRN